MAGTNFLNDQDWWKTVNVSEKEIFPKVLLWRGRMALSQSSRKLFGRKPEMNCSMFQKDVINIFFSERSFFIWKCLYGLYWHIEFKFESYAEKTLTKGQTSFTQCPETIRNKKIRILFSGLIIRTRIIQFWQSYCKLFVVG